MTAVEILRIAREKIAAGWCQGAWAMDAAGNDVCVTDPDACRFCMGGAVRSVVLPNQIEPEPITRLLREVVRTTTNKWSMTGFNDTSGRTQAEVLAVYDKAIELAEASS